MKIFVKTLKGTNFEIEANSDDSVANVKRSIEKAQGADVYPATSQMLIHQGKVLKDETTLGENGVADNSFLVIMLSKKPAAAGASSVSAAPATQAQPQSTTTPTPAAAVPAPVAPQAQSQIATEPAAAAAAAAAVTAAAAASGDANVYGQAASNLVAGSNLENTIQQILDMGGGSWDRDTVVRALRAAYNNPERAVEYLYSGIPEQAEVAPVARTPTATTGGQAANPLAPAGNPLAQVGNPLGQAPQAAVPASGGPNASPLDLFPQGVPSVGSNAGAGSLDFLRNSQQFQALRAMVQANPQILQPMLQELGKQNPQLMRLIQEHQSDFLRLINEPVEGEGNLLSQLASSMPPTVSVTPEEREAIERLEGMGFRRATVLQVYFACNKNEELAANYLLDHMDEFENEDDEGLS